MPIYEYECLVCGLHFERFQHMTDPPVQRCPRGHNRVRRVIFPAGVIFKGSGFYVTDNRQEGKHEGTKGKENDRSRESD